MSSSSLQLLRCSVHSVVYTRQGCCTNRHWWPITQGPAGFTSQSNTQVWGEWAQQAFNLWVWKNPDSEGNLGVELWTPLVRQFQAQPKKPVVLIKKCVPIAPRTTYHKETLYCCSILMEAEAWKYSRDQGPRTRKHWHALCPQTLCFEPLLCMTLWTWTLYRYAIWHGHCLEQFGNTY